MILDVLLGTLSSIAFTCFLLSYAVALCVIRKSGRIGLVSLIAAALLSALGFWEEGALDFGSEWHTAIGYIPFAILPIILWGIALGVFVASTTLWLSSTISRFLGWPIGLAACAYFGVIMLDGPIRAEIRKNEFEERQHAIVRADFRGTLSGHEIVVPGYPRLELEHNCGPEGRIGNTTCLKTDLTQVGRRYQNQDLYRLHQRTDTIRFDVIRIRGAGFNCENDPNCGWWDKTENWCTAVRPNQSDTIWCKAPQIFDLDFRSDLFLPYPFTIRTELGPNYEDALLGSGTIFCEPAEHAKRFRRQVEDCALTFEIAENVNAIIYTNKHVLENLQPMVDEVVADVPEFWAAMREGR